MKKKKIFRKFMLGAIVGAGIGVLFAPRKGSETRERLKLKLDEFSSKIKDIDSEEVKLKIEQKINEIKDGLDDLDKEKVLKIAKKKAHELQEMSEQLVEFAIEKGTPVIEKSADAIRKKTIIVTREILKKLEQEDK